MTEVYLDNNATTRPTPEVRAAVGAAIDRFWQNPSSGHRAGETVRQQIELAREAIANLLGCRDREIVLTAGGTEADNLALRGSLDAQPGRRVIATARTEHSAVRETAQELAGDGVRGDAGDGAARDVRDGPRRSVEVVWLELDAVGLVRMDALADLLARRAGELALVSVMWANNETGLVQPVEEIGALCAAHGVRFHTDAVQWVGKMPVCLAELPVDLLSFSAHKFHGPKGAGGLFVRRGLRIAPQISGGPQERGRRGGTENVPGILGLAAAARGAGQWLETDERHRLARLRDAFERRVTGAVGETVVNAAAGPRIWNTTNIGFRRLEAEALLIMLSERGVCASAGAACSSGSLEPSPVLLASGVPEDFAHGSIRFSLSRDTTEEDLNRAAETVREVVTKHRASLSAV